MKASVPFLLLPLALLSACIMETPKPSNEMGPYPYITDLFDFVNSDFNRATFNSQRALWQERSYKDYKYVLSLSTRDNREAPFNFYRCEVVVKESKDPEVVWFEGDDPELMIPLEGALPEDIPSVYTMEGIYDYILAVIENLAGRAKEGNEGFSVYIRYEFDNTPNIVRTARLENGVYHTFRKLTIQVRRPPAVEDNYEN
jgi:hypothetical protein